MTTILKSWSLILLEPSGPVQPCNGIVLPIYFTYHFSTFVLGSTRFPPHFKIPSLHCTSHHLPLCKPCSWKYSIYSVFQNPFTSLPCTSLHLSLFKPCSWKYSIYSVLQKPLHFTSLHLHFTELHFTYHFATSFLGSTRFPL